MSRVGAHSLTQALTAVQSGLPLCAGNVPTAFAEPVVVCPTATPIRRAPKSNASSTSRAALVTGVADTGTPPGGVEPGLLRRGPRRC
jgi:hypothetical protein